MEHNCISFVNNRLVKLENIVKEFVQKLEQPKEDSDDTIKAITYWNLIVSNMKS